MPVNWDEFDNEVDSAIERGAQTTDDQLASRVSSLTRMTDEEIIELFPEPGDVKKLGDLMKIVKSAETQNTKINNIVNNAEQFGGVVLTLLTKFA